MMKRHWLAMALVLAGFVGCKRDNEPNKILDGLPINNSQTCLPGQMGQAWFATKRDGLVVIIPVMNRTVQRTAFPEFAGQPGPMYTFQTSERHYGTANFSFQFRDGGGSVIDPIQNASSTNTIKSIDISVSGTHNLFTYTETLVLTLETAGVVNSTLRLTGTSNFTGSSNTLAFTLGTPGPRCTYQNLIDGTVSATGTGPASQPTSLNLTFYPDHNADGVVLWEGLVGGIHLLDTANGYIITNQFRLLLD